MPGTGYACTLVKYGGTAVEALPLVVNEDDMVSLNTLTVLFNERQYSPPRRLRKTKRFIVADLKYKAC